MAATAPAPTPTGESILLVGVTAGARFAVSGINAGLFCSTPAVFLDPATCTASRPCRCC